VDAAGNVYIAEFEGHPVRKVGTDGKISTVAGIGIAGFGGDGGPATSAQLSYPTGLTVDQAARSISPIRRISGSGKSYFEASSALYSAGPPARNWSRLQVWLWM
jgi:hypothetical protein